jgi:hypothetical protein
MMSVGVEDGKEYSPELAFAASSQLFYIAAVLA